MCTLPAFDVKQYGDYPDYVERSRVLLATINDHNTSVNNINGTASEKVTETVTRDTK